MCGSGGDGGAEEMRRQEAEREYQNAQATRQVNSIFGIEDGYGAEDFGYGYTLNDDQKAAQTASKNAAARDAMYSTTSSDIINYFKDQLQSQYDDAMEQAKYGLARKRQTGSQAEIDLHNKILETFNTGLNNITSRADSTVADLRGADEQARLNLLNSIQAGMDASSAVSGANAALKGNVDRFKSAAMAQGLDNLFKQISELNDMGAYVQGANRAMTPYRDDNGLTVNNTGSYSGTVYS